MIHLTYSNRTEVLAARFVAHLAAERSRGFDPFESVDVVVPNPNVASFVELEMARGLGVAANLRLMGLMESLREAFGDVGEGLLLGSSLVARVFHALSSKELLEREAMREVRQYFHSTSDRTGSTDRARVQLTLRVARFFEEYALSRPHLLRAWRVGDELAKDPVESRVETWQSELWRYLRDLPQSAGWLTPDEAFEELDAANWPRKPITIFGLSYVAPLFARLFAAWSVHREVFIYAFNPCEEFWEDLETEVELKRRRRRTGSELTWLWEGDDPFGLSSDTDTALLRAWGRPGRENVRLLSALTECDFEAAFDDPLHSRNMVDTQVQLPLFRPVEPPTLLAQVQHDVLQRVPALDTSPSARRGDESIKVIAAPSVRREVEHVAAEIWRSLDTLDELRFPDIAVLMPETERARYVPHIQAVFEQAHRIPYALVGHPMLASSGVIDAALSLLSLPLGELSRRDVLDFFFRPCVHSRYDNIDIARWTELVDQLGIFRGSDHAAQEGTYARDDALNWNQGLQRLTLGIFLGDEEIPFELNGTPYVPHGAGFSDADARQLLLLVRALLSDVQGMRTATFSLSGWSAYLSRLLTTHLKPEAERDASAFRRVLTCVESLAALDMDGAAVSYAAVYELLKGPIKDAQSTFGQPLVDGVFVGTLSPLRALPFRAVFLLGFGDGAFPSVTPKDPMDLRSFRRLAGDVSSTERDQYALLETILHTRDRLCWSYVNRDEYTGEPREPASVLRTFLDVLVSEYLPQGVAHLTQVVPGLRHESRVMRRLFAKADTEARAVQMGREIRPQLNSEHMDDVHAALRVDPEWRRLLALHPLPDEEVRLTESAPSVVVRLSELRRFFDSPLTAWMRRAFRLPRSDDGESWMLCEEPTSAEARVATPILREAFGAYAMLGSDWSEVYTRLVTQERARGQWPMGVLADLESEAHQKILQAWENSLHSRFTEGLPNTVFRYRFGASKGQASRWEEIVPLNLEIPSQMRADTVYRLSGKTSLFVNDVASWGVLESKWNAAKRHRNLARAFVDHVVLAATKLDYGTSEVLFFYGDGTSSKRFRLSAIEQGRARTWLTFLLDTYVAQGHAYRLPFEARTKMEKEADPQDPSAWLEAIGKVTGGGDDQYAPVRDLEEVSLPSSEVLARAIEQTFALIEASIEEVKS